MALQEPLPDDVTETIARCAGALHDLERLRDELHLLRLSSDPRAQFATSLFDLERARRGDQEARGAMLGVADALLVFWREGTGAELAAVNPVLGELWESAASLLASFEVKRFERSLAACWEARAEASRLAIAIEALQPEGNRRVEFARCLYHLELARQFVDSSRAEFARRVGLLSEAYQSEEVAGQLVGDDEGLQVLWAEVRPYLDEFFEHLEALAERRKRAEVKTDPANQALVPEAVGEAREVPSFRTLTRPAPPHLTPRPMPAVSVEALDDDVIEAVLEVDDAPPPPPRTPTGEIEIIEAVEEYTQPPPPPPNFTPARGVFAGEIELPSDDFDEAPDVATTAFWDHTFDRLGLLPEGENGRSARLLACESRTDRKRLAEFVDTLEPFHEVAEARSFACLIKLMVAGQAREKSLFGQPNPRRVEALVAALPYLGASPASAGHAAVWFDLDGPQTQEALGKGLELLAGYLAWCSRAGKDPLSADAAASFARP